MLGAVADDKVRDKARSGTTFCLSQTRVKICWIYQRLRDRSYSRLQTTGWKRLDSKGVPELSKACLFAPFFRLVFGDKRSEILQVNPYSPLFTLSCRKQDVT